MHELSTWVNIAQQALNYNKHIILYGMYVRYIYIYAITTEAFLQIWGSLRLAPNTGNMQGLVWGEPELAHVCI